MSKDPWKKAHDLSRIRQQQQLAADHASKQLFEPPRSRPRWSFSLVVSVVVILLVGGAAAAYFTRSIWWPQVGPRLPEELTGVVEEAAPELRPTVDWHALDKGLGADLRQFTSYLDFVDAVREWGAGKQLKLISTGEGRWRVTATGVKVYVQDGMIWTYELELNKIYAAAEWNPWWPELRAAGLVPELSWEDVTGDPNFPPGHAEHRMRRTPATRVREGWVYPVFILHFSYGKLTSLEAAVDYGVSEPATPEDA